MNDRIHPSSRPATNGVATGNPPFPATKAQLYGATRPAYRPQAPKRHRRCCCCSCCLWSTLAVFLVLVVVAAAGAVVYLIYRPHRPSFSVSTLKIQTLNITKTQILITSITLNVVARNPNKEVKFYYDPITVFVTTNDDVEVGEGAFPAFVHGTKNTTLLKAAIKNNNGQELDDLSASKLKTELKSKSGLPLKIKLETKVKAKMGAIKTPKVRIRVSCEGIRATVPTGKTSASASTSNVKCKVDMKIKIWKLTF